jgi:hypothetical protein
MYIYNVTSKIDTGIEEEWLAWLKEEHIPDMISTGCFTGAGILKLLETDDTEGPTYTVQYKAESNSLYNHYIEKFSQNMRRKSLDKWGNKFIAFRSLMQVVN